jgi:hypothetical protein
MKKIGFLFPVIILLVMAGCKKKKDNGPNPGPGPGSSANVPMVATLTVASITSHSAVGGGLIQSDRGAPVTASGICYSSTVKVPTITNDTTKGTVAEGNYTANMFNLQQNVTYYVRAYAINSRGVGYGDVVSFTTSNNTPPEARDITIVGGVQVNSIIRARFTYFDVENDPVLPATFQWYVADNNTTAGDPIAGATDSTYLIPPAQQGKFLKVIITPRASTGNGRPASSVWAGPVISQETVTFNYNGRPVTYGVITSAKTGRKFLDRNLGAPNVPTGVEDLQNMGDLFQWGRGADGHQLINRPPVRAFNTGVNDTTSVLSNNDNPGHSLFIAPDTLPYNWRRPHNPNLWTVSGGVNNVCPAGWHVPSRQEWRAEEVGNLADAYTKLKITTTGIRRSDDGRVVVIAGSGYYWSSSASLGPTLQLTYFMYVPDNTIASLSLDDFPASGMAVRCIKD